MDSVAWFQNDGALPSLLVSGSNIEAHVISDDEGIKVMVDVGSDNSCQNDLTLTVMSESSTGRPTPGDVECSSVPTTKPAEPSSVAAARTADTTEFGASELSSQESSVTRTRSRDVMDFEHLRKKLVELTGPNKEATAGHGTATGKIKPEVDEAKDMSVDTVGAVPSLALTATPNMASQVNVGRPVTGSQQVLGVDGHRGPSTTPEPSSHLTAPVQATNQQASPPELQPTTVVPQDVGVHPGPVDVGQIKLVSSDEENATAPVQPVKPVPVYPTTITQQKLMSGSVGQVNGSTVIPQVPAPDIQAATLHQQQHHMASAVTAAVDNTGGFVPVLPSVVGDMSCPASPDSISQVMAPQQLQPTALDYSQASLLALYNQMMMPLPLMAPAWPALGLNPFLVAANPLLAAQMMYRAPLMPPVSEPLGQMPALDPQLGVPGYAMAGQAHPQPVMPGLGHPQTDHAVRAAVMLPSSGTSLPSSVTPVGVATRPIAPRLPVAVSGYEHHPAGHVAGVQRKRPDRPPYLASLEQALIEKLHGPRKPVAAMIPGQAVHSPAAQSLPGAMAWFPMPYGAHMQHGIHTPVAVSSPLLNTDLQPPPSSASGLTADMAVSVSTYATLPGTSLVGSSTHSGRSTPSVATSTEYVTGKSTAAATLPSSQKLTSETSAAVDGDLTFSTERTPSKHKLQFTVSAVKDDPLAAGHQQESTTVCEALIVSSESVQNPQDTVPCTQTSACVASASKASVKKGRFRISDVKEGVDVIVSNSQLESSSQQPQAAGLISGPRNDPSGICETTAALMAPEIVIQQVRPRMLSALAAFCVPILVRSTPASRPNKVGLKFSNVRPCVCTFVHTSTLSAFASPLSIHFFIFCSFLLFPFSFSHSLYLFSSIVHPIPFYQNRPISFWYFKVSVRYRRKKTHVCYLIS